MTQPRECESISDSHGYVMPCGCPHDLTVPEQPAVGLCREQGQPVGAYTAAIDGWVRAGWEAVRGRP